MAKDYSKWEEFKKYAGLTDATTPSRRFMKFEQTFGHDKGTVEQYTAEQIWELAGSVRTGSTADHRRVRERRRFCVDYLEWLGCEPKLIKSVAGFGVSRLQNTTTVAMTQTFPSAKAVDDFILDATAKRLHIDKFSADTDVLLPLRCAMQLIYNGLSREDVCTVTKKEILHDLPIEREKNICAPFDDFQSKLLKRFAKAEQYHSNSMQVEKMVDSEYLLRSPQKAAADKNSFTPTDLSNLVRAFNKPTREKQLTIGGVAMSGKFHRARIAEGNGTDVDEAIRQTFGFKNTVTRTYLWEVKKVYEQWKKLT